MAASNIAGKEGQLTEIKQHFKYLDSTVYRLTFAAETAERRGRGSFPSSFLVHDYRITNSGY